MRSIARSGLISCVLILVAFQGACEEAPGRWVLREEGLYVLADRAIKRTKVEVLLVELLEGHQHKMVRFDDNSGARRLYLSQFEVTQAEWDSVLGRRPANRNGALPTEPSDDRYIREFLSAVTKRSGLRSRLPTKEEWLEVSRSARAWDEYAPSGRALSRFIYRDKESREFYRDPWPVGSGGVADDRGFFDLIGNVAERVEGEPGSWYACGGSYAQSWELYQTRGPCVRYSSIVTGLGAVGFRFVVELEKR